MIELAQALARTAFTIRPRLSLSQDLRLRPRLNRCLFGLGPPLRFPLGVSRALVLLGLALHSPPSLPAKPVLLDPPFQVPLEGSSSVQLVRASCQNGPPPKRTRPCKQDGSGMEAIRSHSAANSKVATELMMQLLAFLGSESGTFNSLQSAVHYHQHIRRVLAGFAATTVIRYITTFNNFARTCEDLDVCILEITEVQAADILGTLQLQKREDPALGPSAVTCIKAIRWVRRHAQCNVFEVFFGGLISSFLRSTLPKDRCESVPLPLFALVQWERRILQRNTPVVDDFC